MYFKQPHLCKILFGFAILFNSLLVFSQNIYWPYQSSTDYKYLSNNIIRYVMNSNTIKYSYSSNLLLNPIVMYQNTLSRSSCQYFPSCSRYTYQSINNYGNLKGLIMGAERLTRCFYSTDGSNYFRIHPFYYDPPYDLFNKRINQRNLSFEFFINRKFNYYINSAYSQCSFNNLHSDSSLFTQNTDSLLFLFQNKDLHNSELSFAVYMYEMKQYFQSANELYRYLHAHPDESDKSSIWLLLSCCNFQAGRYYDSAKLFEYVSLNSSDKKKYVFSKYMKGLSHLSAGNYLEAQDTFKNLILNDKTDFYRQQILFGYCSSCLKMYDIQSALEILDKENKSNYINEMRHYLAARNNKSSLCATIFSAIIPGGGQFYSGHYREGIFSFIVNSILGYLFYDSYHNGTSSNKIFHGLLFFQFYSANILAGKRSVEIHNEIEIDKILTELQNIISIRFEFPLCKKDNNIYLVVE